MQHFSPTWLPTALRSPYSLPPPANLTFYPAWPNVMHPAASLVPTLQVTPPYAAPVSCYAPIHPTTFSSNSSTPATRQPHHSTFKIRSRKSARPKHPKAKTDNYMSPAGATDTTPFSTGTTSAGLCEKPTPPLPEGAGKSESILKVEEFPSLSGTVSTAEASNSQENWSGSKMNYAAAMASKGRAARLLEQQQALPPDAQVPPLQEQESLPDAMPTQSGKKPTKKRTKKKKAKKPKQPGPIDWEEFQREKLGIKNPPNNPDTVPDLTEEEFPDLGSLSLKDDAPSHSMSGKKKHTHSNEPTNHVTSNSDHSNVIPIRLFSNPPSANSSNTISAHRVKEMNVKPILPMSSLSLPLPATTSRVTQYRGKERETPKPKRPNRFKRLILNERKLKTKLSQTDTDALGYMTDPEMHNQHAAGQTAAQTGPDDNLFETCSLSGLSDLTAVDNQIVQKMKLVYTPHKACQDTQCKICLGHHCKRFREYCDHQLSTQLDDKVALLLTTILFFQDRMHRRDPQKARIRRRYVIGLREIKKQLSLKKLKLLIIAPDVERAVTKGSLDDTIVDLIGACASQGTTYLFSLRRRPLGHVMKRFVPIAAVGIMDYSGADVLVKEIINLLGELRDQYDQLIARDGVAHTFERRSASLSDSLP